MGMRIYDTDTIEQMARKIWEFEVHASCSIYGFVRKDSEEVLVPKGELVCKSLQVLYDLEYKDEKGRIKQKFRKDSIGGPIAHKCFTWERRIVDGDVRYTIWRVQ